MREGKIKNFEDFWPYYLGEHQHPLTRLIHFIGTLSPIALIPISLITGRVWILLLWPAISYSLAWFSHFFIERNKPATWTYPLFSLRADYRMCGFIMTGRMSQELERVKSTKNL